MIADGQPGHIDQIKQMNAGSVYRLIDLFGPISRIDLSKKAQLAPASITKIVRELLEAHLIKETEFQDIGSRGRPAIGLMLDTESWHYLSVRLGKGVITLGLHDLSSQLIVEDVLPLTGENTEHLQQNIINEINQFFIRYQNRLERLTAIAITLPGMVNPATGIVHKMPFYDIENMHLGAALEACTGVPVYLQHDISAWTLAEALFGASRGCMNVIQIVIDHNVGAGVITGGRILTAGSNGAVEVGHTQVDPYGKQCYCGNHGCLETVASIQSMLDIARQRLQSSMSSRLNDVPLSVESLCEAALANDPLAKDIILGVGQSVGRVIAIMVNLFNPEKILVGSPLNQAAEILHPAIAASIQQQALPAYSAHTYVESTQFMNQGTMPGAALIKEALYNGSLLIRLLQG